MSVFKNRQKLSSKHVPNKLPHRDEQLRQLFGLFEDIREGNVFFKTVQLIGSVGTGKTSSSLLFIREMSKLDSNVYSVYVNLKMLSDPSPFLVYSSLLTAVGVKPSRSRSPGELFEKFLSIIQKRRKDIFIIVIDEADELTGTRSLKGGKIVYNLTRFPEFGVENIAGTIFIARRNEWSEGLSFEEKSSLGSIIVYYPRYTKEQINDILRYRISESFKEDTLEPHIIEYLAEITADLFQSDIRKALDILLYAGILADLEGAEKVEIVHVNRAIRNVLGYTVVSSDILSMLSFEDKITLYATILSLENSPRGYVSMSTIREYVEMLCETLRVKEISDEIVELSLQKLYELGIIDMNGPRKIHVLSMLNVNELKKEIVSHVRNRSV